VLKRYKISLALSLTLLITACSFSVNEADSTGVEFKVSSNTEVDYEAKATGFEEGGFTNNRGQLIALENGELILSGAPPYDPKRTTTIDLIFQAEGYDSPPVYQAYKNAEITTEGDRYFITADNGLSLEFTKIGDRIIVDEEGEEYFTKNHPK